MNFQKSGGICREEEEIRKKFVLAGSILCVLGALAVLIVFYNRDRFQGVPYCYEIREKYDSEDKILMEAWYIRPYLEDIFSGPALKKVNAYYEGEMEAWIGQCEEEMQYWRETEEEKKGPEGDEYAILFSNYDYRRCDIVYIDEEVVSIIENHEAYSGGAAHGSHGKKCRNFDRETGEEISLDRLAAAEEEKEELAGLIYDKLMETPKEKRLFSNDEAELRRDIREAMEKSENFYFTKDGIVWVFETYSIAPYAAGVIEAEVRFPQ